MWNQSALNFSRNLFLLEPLHPQWISLHQHHETHPPLHVWEFVVTLETSPL